MDIGNVIFLKLENACVDVYFKNNNQYSLNCIYDVRCEQYEVTGCGLFGNSQCIFATLW